MHAAVKVRLSPSSHTGQPTPEIAGGQGDCRCVDLSDAPSIAGQPTFDVAAQNLPQRGQGVRPSSPGAKRPASRGWPPAGAPASADLIAADELGQVPAVCQALLQCGCGLIRHDPDPTSPGGAGNSRSEAVRFDPPKPQRLMTTLPSACPSPK
jgi:hypothetical protein